MIAQVIEATGSKDGIKSRSLGLRGRILSSTPQGGMKTEDGQEDWRGPENIRLQASTQKGKLALSLHCMKCNKVPWNLALRGQRLGLQMGHGFCAELAFPGLFLPYDHNKF